MTDYAFVNQKTINGKTYTAYRSTENPKDVKVEIAETGETIKVSNLKEYWNKITWQS